MNPIDRATAQQKKHSPVWEYQVRKNFDIKHPYRLEETEDHLLIIGVANSRKLPERVKNFLKLPKNVYGVSLNQGEQIEKVIPKEDYVKTGYIYYDDPEETEEERKEYIKSLQIHNPYLRDSFGELIDSIEFKGDEIVYIKRVKDEKPFNYKPSNIK